MSQLTRQEALNLLAKGESTSQTLQEQTCWSKIAQDGINLSGINKNIKYVQQNQSIQSVLDTITDASADNLYEVMVPPGHEDEAYIPSAHISVSRSGRRESDFVIAASNSMYRHTADFICDGTDDQVQIQAAIDALPSGEGGTIKLMAGIYNISATINVNKTLYLIGSGCGFQTQETTCLFLAAGSNCPMFLYEGDGGAHIFFGLMQHLEINGNESNNTVASSFITLNGTSDFIFRECIFHEIPSPTSLAVLELNASSWGTWFINNDIENSDGIGLLTKTHRTWIINNHFRNMYRGIKIEGGSAQGSGWIINNDFKDIEKNGLWLRSSYGLVVDGNRFMNIGTGGTGSGCIDIQSPCDTAFITKNYLLDADINTEYGIKLLNASGTAIDYVQISNNDFRKALTAPILIEAGGLNPNGFIRNNIGHVTENSGTATVLSATTSIEVTHGLSVTPVAGDIMITPMENIGNATVFWVDTYTSNSFMIRTDVAPGADTDFAWKALVL